MDLISSLLSVPQVNKLTKRDWLRTLKVLISCRAGLFCFELPAGDAPLRFGKHPSGETGASLAIHGQCLVGPRLVALLLEVDQQEARVLC